MAILMSMSWMLSWRIFMKRTIRWDKRFRKMIFHKFTSDTVTFRHITDAKAYNCCFVIVSNLRTWTLRVWQVISRVSWHCRTVGNCTAQSWRLFCAGNPCSESRLPDLHFSSVPAAWLLLPCACAGHPFPFSLNEFWKSVRTKAQMSPFLFHNPSPLLSCAYELTQLYDAHCSILNLYI